MRVKTMMSIALVASMSLVTVGCSSGSQPTPKPAATNQSTVMQKVIFTAGAKTVSDWNHYVAQANGLYKKYGVELTSVSTQTAANALQLLVTGNANIGRGLAPTIQIVNGSKGAIKLIDVGDSIIRPPFTVNAKTAKTWEDMVGKKLGVSSPTDSTAVVAKHALDILGTEGVVLTNSGGTGSRLAALVGGALDAALLLPPANFTAEDEGFNRMSYLPDELGPDWLYAFTSTIVEPKWAAANKDAIKGVLAAQNEALVWMADPSNKDAAIEILAKAIDISPEIAKKTYELLGIATDHSAFATESGINKGAANGVLNALKTMGQVPESFSLADVTDDSYAAEVREEFKK